MSKAEQELLRQQTWRGDLAGRRQTDVPPLVEVSPKWAVSPQMLAFVLGLGLLTLAVLWPWLGEPPVRSSVGPGEVVTLSSTDHSSQQRQPSGLLMPGPAN